jgi:hypothetical protein
LHRAALSVQARDLDLQGLEGLAIAERVRQARVDAIHAVRAAHIGQAAASMQRNGSPRNEGS